MRVGNKASGFVAPLRPHEVLANLDFIRVWEFVAEACWVEGAAAAERSEERLTNERNG